MRSGGRFMETVYDWITIGIFAGLIVLFMQRSTTRDDSVHDPLWMYLVGGAGCGVANYLGNQQLHVLAVIVLVATLAFIVHFLKPFPSGRSN
jgi:Ca2+/Na+ antiporter